MIYIITIEEFDTGKIYEIYSYELLTHAEIWAFWSKFNDGTRSIWIQTTRAKYDDEWTDVELNDTPPTAFMMIADEYDIESTSIVLPISLNERPSIVISVSPQIIIEHSRAPPEII